MQTTVPCLWFDGQAEEAARFYVKTFKDSKMIAVVRYGDAGPGPKGTAMTVQFRINGQEFLGLNGGPQFKFTEAVSFIVYCRTQREIDRLWTRLTEGGRPVQCGWLRDKFGLSWQIVPTILPKLMMDRHPARRDRVMRALLPMTKLDIAGLERAARGTDPPGRRRRRTR
jgi:predicted 3-demethylubiquinone-9 3-methyltransferase (glyoxalase superfamily)